MKSLCLAGLLSLFAAIQASAADPIFSGPQPGEKTTPFKALDLAGPGEGKERDPITENAGAPTVLVFLHAVERSMLPLLRVIDQYGEERKDKLKREVVFLFADRLEGERRVKTVNGSLKLKSRVGLSLDSAEGPGNYGLNKDCMMTIVVAKDNKVTANFALVQPGIADAPKVIEALARACGDTAPPTVEHLTSRAPADRRMEQMQQGGARFPVMQDKPKENFPGAVPTDSKLTGMLREFIRPTNDEATVDRLASEVQIYIKGNADLTKQAIDGWTRILHFGDRYGTPHSRKVGQEMLAKLKAESGIKPNEAK